MLTSALGTVGPDPRAAVRRSLSTPTDPSSGRVVASPTTCVVRSSPLRSRASGSASSATSTGTGSPRSPSSSASAVEGRSRTSRPSGRLTRTVREASKRVKRSLAAVCRDDGSGFQVSSSRSSPPTSACSRRTTNSELSKTKSVLRLTEMPVIVHPSAQPATRVDRLSREPTAGTSRVTVADPARLSAAT